MLKTPEMTFKLSRLAAVAGALALAATASHASLALLSVDSISVTASNGYVFTVDKYRSFTMNANNAGGLGGAQGPVNFSATDWNDTGTPVVAQTAYALARGTSSGLTDSAALLTPTMSLRGETSVGGIYAGPASPNYANANGNLAGAFTLIDYDNNGDPFDVGGFITFRVDYTLDVSSITGSPITDYAQADLNLMSSDSDEDFDGPGGWSINRLSTNYAGGSYSISDYQEWTFDLAAGDWATFSFTGSAIAASHVPEPSSLLLAALALAAVGGAARRGKTA